MADKSNKNPLEELFTDSSNHINPSELLAILKPFIGINRQNNKVIFTPEGLLLKPNKKIILFLLSKKVLCLLGTVPSESVAPRDIKNEFSKNIPAGTVDVTIKRLSDTGLIKGEQAKYYIPDFNFPKIKEMFTSKSEE
ncbi:MAG: hypothetical protein Q7R98_01955 [Candidatus Jorgensenbacteria bacterium]|nr:hypothetical protein [Candidatus Jorgensenbacteria bacterium]